MVQQECVDKHPMSASVLIRRCLEDRQTSGYCGWPLPQGSHLACSPVPSWPTLDLPPWPPPTVYLTTSYPGTEATSPTCDGERPPSLSFCLSRYVTILTLPGTGTTWGEAVGMISFLGRTVLRLLHFGVLYWIPPYVEVSVQRSRILALSVFSSSLSPGTFQTSHLASKGLNWLVQ